MVKEYRGSDLPRTRNGLAAAPEEFVEEHPASSMLLAFAVGIGVGVVLGHSITDVIARSFDRDSRQLADRLNRLWQGAIPDSLARHLRS